MSIKNTKFAILIIAMACMSDSWGTSYWQRFKNSASDTYSYYRGQQETYFIIKGSSGRIYYNPGISQYDLNTEVNGFYPSGEQMKFRINGIDFEVINYKILPGLNEKTIKNLMLGAGFALPIYSGTSSGIPPSVILKTKVGDKDKYYIGYIQKKSQDLSNSQFYFELPKNYVMSFHDITPTDVGYLQRGTTIPSTFIITKKSGYYTIQPKVQPKSFTELGTNAGTQNASGGIIQATPIPQTSGAGTQTDME